MEQIAAIESPRLGVNAMAFSPDGNLLVLAGGWGGSLTSKGYLGLWDIHKGAFRRMTEGRHGWNRIVVSPDGRKIVTASLYQVHVWRVEPWTSSILTKNWLLIEGLDISTDGRMVAVIGRLPVRGNPKGLMVYDVETGKEIHSLRGDFSGVSFSPKGDQLAASSETEITFLNLATWKRETATPPGTSPGASGPTRIHGVSVLADGRSVALDTFTQVMLWDRAHEEQLRSIAAVRAALAGDGQHMATIEYVKDTGTYNLTLRDLPTLKTIAQRSLGDHSPSLLTVSRDGGLLAGLDTSEEERRKNQGGRVIVWSLGPGWSEGASAAFGPPAAGRPRHSLLPAGGIRTGNAILAG